MAKPESWLIKSVRRLWRSGSRSLWLRQLLTLICLVLMLAHTQGSLNISGVDALERGLYDWRMRWLMSSQLEPQVVIVDIDETSLASVGHWPWSRARVAELVRILTQERGVRTLAFDMVFAEPTSSTENSVAATADEDLLSAVRNAPVILGYYLTSDRGGVRYGQLPPAVWQVQGEETAPSTTVWSGYGASLSQLAATASAGFFNIVTSEDGLVRRLPLLAQVDSGLYENLALAAYRRWAGLSQLALLRAPKSLDPQGRRVQSILLSSPDGKQQKIRVDEWSAVWPNFRKPGGQKGQFRYISAIDLLNRSPSLPDLRGSLVLIGSSAPGLQDIRATPVAAAYPGVEIHASLIADLMGGQVAAPPPESTAWTWLVVLVLGLILIAVLSRTRAWISLLTGLALLVGLLSMAWQAQERYGWILQIAPAVALVLMALLLNMLYSYLSERQLRQLTEQFGSYLPLTLVREMYATRQSGDMRADYRNMTVLFCDIREFTGIAERLKPAEMQNMLNQFLSCMGKCVGDARGTLDKFMGDSVMAFWGAPMKTENHATLAIECAQAMVHAIASLNETLALQRLPTIQVGVGIATGPMFVGDMGSVRRRSYTVIGDTVNVASRLQELSKTTGHAIVVNEQTRHSVSDLTWQQLESVALRGRQRLVMVYGLEPLTGDPP